MRRRELRRVASTFPRADSSILDQCNFARHVRGKHNVGLGALGLPDGLFLLARGNGVALRSVHNDRLPY